MIISSIIIIGISLNILFKPVYIVIFWISISLIYMIFKYIKLLKKYRLANNLKCELNKTIKEKELLLNELNHRVKNNLQIVLSILNIQSRICKIPELDLFIEKCETRIKSMLLIHEMLCFSENVSNVDFKEYIQELISNIYKTFDNNNIKYNIQMDSVEFDIVTAIPLGLIINELLNNSFKYGFVDEKSGIIDIELKNININSYKLVVRDNGIGFDVASSKFGSIGLYIVKILVDQMSGKYQIKSENGVECVILFQI